MVSGTSSASSARRDWISNMLWLLKKKKKIKAFTAKSGILLISILSILLFTPTGPAPN